MIPFLYNSPYTGRCESARVGVRNTEHDYRRLSLGLASAGLFFFFKRLYSKIRLRYYFLLLVLNYILDNKIVFFK